MSLTLPLSQQDRDYLVQQKEGLEEQNTNIEDSNESIGVELAEVHFLDIPSKKQTDPVHIDIYFYEEELRRLNGLTVVNPLQEAAILVEDSQPNSRLYVNDGRLILEENSSEVANVPLLPSRGYTRSQVVGTDFDIWTQDRYGSTTSEINASTSFVIDSSNSRLRVNLDGKEQEVDFASLFVLPQTMEGSAVASTLQALFTGIEVGEAVSQNAEPYVLSDGSQMSIVVDSGAAQTVTFNSGDFANIESVTAQEIVDVLNTNWTGITASDSDGNVSITHDGSTEFQISDGTGNPNLIIGLSEYPIYDDSAFPTMACFFYTTLNTITVVSGTAGSSSSAEVVNATSNDMRNTIGFATQTQIAGRYASNILNVEIDGVAEEIAISDSRLCVNSPTLGDNNDVTGINWSGLGNELGVEGNTRLGPYFCAGIDNGKDVAASIQAQLRAVGSGGFEKAQCDYFTDSSTFVIRSGDFGTTSSVKVLAASDPLRDARTLLGFDPADEEIGSEDYYETINDLNNFLGGLPNVTTSLLGNINTLCHSILYTRPDGVKLDSGYQAFPLAVTPVYDDGSRGLPPLYSNGKVVINYNNRWIDISYPDENRELGYKVLTGEYSESELAEALTNELPTGYSCEYDVATKKFTISNSSDFSIFLGTGQNASQSVGYILGFDISSDKTGFSSYTSDNEVSFASEDPLSINFPDQFYADSLPVGTDNDVSEQYNLQKEDEYLNWENDSPVLGHLLAATSYDNEVRTYAWESVASSEIGYVGKEREALLAQRGAFINHLDESDSEVTIKDNALANLQVNYDDLVDKTSNLGAILNRTQSVDTFQAGVDFTNGGIESLAISISAGASNTRVYSNPAPLVNQGGGNHIAGRFSPVGLYDTNVTYTPETLQCFELKSYYTTYSGNTVTGVKAALTSTQFTTEVEWSGGSAIDLNIDITISPNNTIAGLVSTIDALSDYSAKYYGAGTQLLSRIPETYSISDGLTLIVDPNGSGNQTITFDAEIGTSTSGTQPATRIVSGSNDRLVINVDDQGADIYDEILISSAIGGETDFTTDYSPVKQYSTSGLIDHASGPDTILEEGLDYTVNYATGEVTLVSPLVIGDQLRMSYIRTIAHEIILGTQNTEKEIAQKIQNEVRKLDRTYPKDHVSYANFTCIYSYTYASYILKSGTGGLGSKVEVTSSGTDDAAASLKLGTANGGTETVGSGDFINSKFATLQEVIDKINATASNFVAGGIDYLSIASTLTGSGSSIVIDSGSSALAALGFEQNNSYIPSTDLVNFQSSSLVNFSNEEIKDPSSKVVERGHDTSLGNIDITYYTIDDSEITNRQSLIANRLSQVSTRDSEISARVGNINSALSNSLYEARRDAVEFRLNRQTGSYVKVGDKYNQLDTNNDTIDANNDAISNIDGLL